ncbi:FtsX-like permease family protein [Phytoactinopolyspora alkaliphila]|uniref:FtsX-like permease family protein n=1 Tax=Phytoactinopolyspora alkaliphila TaxID=1783498 RepID=A0A6N9YK47_9ACTN|nr:FtsX-like permease family protein [Phytoactinopolyspora alkaliphila]NED95332.1 FtsX-like permease family protein [Phytoactinopolyspora alkaliphila]
MRANVGRLVAAGVAIVIATAFVTATLLSTSLIERTAYNAILTAYPNADVIATQGILTPDVLEQVRATSGVAGADGRYRASVVLNAGGQSDYQMAAPTPQTSELRLQLADGTYPDGPGEIVISEPIAERLDARAGSTLDIEVDVWTSDDTWERQTETVTVSGIFPDPGAAFDADLPGVFAEQGDLNRWSGIPDDAEPTYHLLMAVAEPGTSAGELRRSLEPLLRENGSVVRTADEYAEAVTADFTADTYLLAAVLMGFGAVAMFAAGMVISNTFAVLVAQRTRQLALLRCVGATRKQVRRGVLAEAATLGIGASVLGIATGISLAQATLAILGRVFDVTWLPTGVPVPMFAAIIPLVVGTLVTILAALSPARAATQVAPLAALRPSVPPACRSRASARRMLVTAGLLLAGGALLAVGVVFTTYGGDVSAGLIVGMAGGAVSFLGVIVGAVVIIPPVVAAVGRVLARQGGVPARIAAVNAMRHPRRTASTAAALLIGVTLVAMMSVGAASAQATLDDELDERYAVDVSVGDEPFGVSEPGMAVPTPLQPQVVDAATTVAGISTAVPLHGAHAEVATPHATGLVVSVLGVDPGAARGVVRAEEELAALAPGTAVVPETLVSELGVEDGGTMTLAVNGRSAEFDVQVARFPEYAVIVTGDDLMSLAPDAELNRLWMALDPSADPETVIREIQNSISQVASTDTAVPVLGAAAERSEISRVLDTMLAVVTALLAVAVLIALIGVSNTLSLSVIERTRESATMRALGLTRRQLRSMLAIEGMIVAGVGALVGIALGAVYGWLGTLTTLGTVWDTTLTVPWPRLGVILLVAVLAGLVASVLPGRRAAKAAPVAALAAE